VALCPLVRANTFLCRRCVVTPLFTRGKFSSSCSIHSVWYKSFNPGSVSRVQSYFSIQKALDAFCLVAAEVAFRTLHPHDFTTPGDMKTALSAFMRFKFWHPEFPLSLLLFCLLKWLSGSELCSSASQTLTAAYQWQLHPLVTLTSSGVASSQARGV